jgi:hypothetical protein
MHCIHLDARKTMKTLSRIILGLALTAPLAVTSAVRADDKTSPDKTSPDKTSPDKTSPGDRKQDVTIDQLPKAVKATVQRETKGKKIASITRSTGSSAAAAYEIKVLDGAKETTIGVANDGKVTGRKTGAAPRSSTDANPPGANPTDANPPRVNSPHATSPSSPPSSSPPSSSPPSSVSPPLANSPSATSPSSPPRSADTPSDDKKQDQRPNPPGR